MTNRLHRLLPLLLLSALCACVSPERTALTTIGTLGTTADAAIGAYSVYIDTHPAPPEEQLRVRQAVKAYVASLEVARTTVTAYKAGTADKAAVDRAIDTLAASAGQLTSLVQLLTAPTPRLQP